MFPVIGDKSSMSFAPECFMSENMLSILFAKQSVGNPNDIIIAGEKSLGVQLVTPTSN